MYYVNIIPVTTFNHLRKKYFCDGVSVLKTVTVRELEDKVESKDFKALSSTRKKKTFVAQMPLLPH